MASCEFTKHSDSGDFQSIASYKPQDATTNPSLILAAVKDPKYASLIDVAVKYAKEHGGWVGASIFLPQYSTEQGDGLS